jgi:hypothetical protein
MDSAACCLDASASQQPSKEADRRGVGSTGMVGSGTALLLDDGSAAVLLPSQVAGGLDDDDDSGVPSPETGSGGSTDDRTPASGTRTGAELRTGARPVRTVPADRAGSCWKDRGSAPPRSCFLLILLLRCRRRSTLLFREDDCCCCSTEQPNIAVAAEDASGSGTEEGTPHSRRSDTGTCCC